MSDYEVLEVPNVQLQRGGLLPTARLAYKTLGTLTAARDNAVLVPTWYTGTHNDIETFMVGEGRALDPRKYFIVMKMFFIEPVKRALYVWGHTHQGGCQVQTKNQPVRE